MVCGSVRVTHKICVGRLSAARRRATNSEFGVQASGFRIRGVGTRGGSPGGAFREHSGLESRVRVFGSGGSFRTQVAILEFLLAPPWPIHKDAESSNIGMVLQDVHTFAHA